MRVLWSLGLSLLTLFCPVAALAWSGPGHQAVAAVAWMDLDADTRDRVVRLLEEHPGFSEEWEPGIADSGIEAGEYLFMRAATWPDEIRPDSRRPPEEQPPSTFFHVRDWHFRNKPVYPPGQTRRPLRQNSDDALKILRISAREAGRPRANTAARSIALCWLFHLVGDVHQPLHAATLVSDEFPEGDAGGNSFLIRHSDENLHAFWDRLFGLHVTFQKAHEIAARTLQEYPRGDLAEIVARPEPGEWLEESYQLAVNHAYNFTNSDGQRITLKPGIKKSDGTIVREPEKLPDRYAANARTVARKQIARAGYRLAAKLREAFRGE
jgi:S1/P1 nuclease